jgi:hypothetical protein
VAANLQAEPEQSLLFERFLPAAEINQVCHDLDHSFRDRIYSPVVTLWMFLGQTLSRDHSCRDAVARLNAWRVEHSKPKAEANTTAYCEARQRLPEAVVAEIARRSGQRCQATADSNWQWKGRNVKLAYHKPACRSVWISKEEYDELDDFVLVRHLRYCVKQKGFRVRHVVLATTLLDASEYSMEDLADLYAQRCQVELDIRSQKTHMQMEHLRCKSPSMVRKEIYAHLISYNLIRDLIVLTALRYSTAPKYLSHTAAVQSLNAFSEKLQAGSNQIEQLERALLETINEHPVGDRKPRVHPREIKRRPKSYKLMNRPRHAVRSSAA